jgi:tetratricopeptide (TPR) repeat protein
MAADDAACFTLKQQVAAEIERAHLAEAEAAVNAALASGDGDALAACLWPAIYDLANASAVAGRLEPAERLAERALRMIDKLYRPADPVRFRVVELLWAVQYQQQKFSRARQTFRVLQSLDIVDPEVRLGLYRTAAAQLQNDGLFPDAEIEYRKALSVAEEAGAGGKTEVIVLHSRLAALYVVQDRAQEARLALEAALSIANSAATAVPRDLVNILMVRAAMYGRQGEWLAAASDFSSAVALSERGAPLDPGQHKFLLRNYAFVLRKLNRKKEAQAVEDLAAAIPAPLSAVGLVDVKQLAGVRIKPGRD